MSLEIYNKNLSELELINKFDIKNNHNNANLKYDITEHIPKIIPLLESLRKMDIDYEKQNISVNNLNSPTKLSTFS